MIPVDHLVLAVPDLADAIEFSEMRWGVRAEAGGAHPGRGTQNALLSLGGESYLELIAPDPAQPVPAGGRPFGVDAASRPHLAGWATAVHDIDGRVAGARAGGWDPGEPSRMQRRLPDGLLLTWHLTPHPDPSILPFLIDWGVSRHPARTAPSGLRLVELRIQTPAPDDARRRLAALGVGVPVDEGPRNALVARLETPLGPTELR